MNYKGVVFDLDGVICNTDEYHYLAWKQLADSLHIPFDREQNNSLCGISRRLKRHKNSFLREYESS